MGQGAGDSMTFIRDFWEAREEADIQPPRAGVRPVVRCMNAGCRKAVSQPSDYPASVVLYCGEKCERETEPPFVVPEAVAKTACVHCGNSTHSLGCCAKCAADGLF